MSETQVDTSTCHASGCPMLATNSRSTNGGGEWLCFLHFSAEQGDRYAITAELTRLRWLVDIVRRLRAGQPLTADMHQNFVLAQRSDLKQKESEYPQQWMIRLEGVLLQSCRDSLVQP
ncbi:MAG: hypothetical protein V4641_31390 [Pseudomonadota bacterium]